MKLAQALLLRKQLEAKVKQLEPLKLQGEKGIFELQTQRVKVSEEIDEVKLQVPRLKLEEVTAEYDKYATALRKLDSAIQEANWTHEVSGFSDKENPLK